MVPLRIIDVTSTRKEPDRSWRCTQISPRQLGKRWKRILFSAHQLNKFPLWKGIRGSARYLSTTPLRVSTLTPSASTISVKHFSISSFGRFRDDTLGSSVLVISATFSPSNSLALIFSCTSWKFVLESWVKQSCQDKCFYTFCITRLPIQRVQHLTLHCSYSTIIIMVLQSSLKSSYE